MTPSENLRGAPYVMAAFICEKVMQEMDSVLSFIRVVDRFVRLRPTAQIPPQPIQAILVTGFKGGDVPTGSYKITVRAFKPGATAPFMEVANDAFFPGTPDTGVTIGTPLLLVADEEGLWWVDVLFMEQIITRVPFRIILSAAPSIQMSPMTGA